MSRPRTVLVLSPGWSRSAVLALATEPDPRKEPECS